MSTLSVTSAVSGAGHRGTVVVVWSREVKGTQEAEIARQAAQAKSEGSLLVGIPCQGYLPYQVTRDPASIVEV